MTAQGRNYWGLIAAGGTGSRMGTGVAKQYRLLAGITVLERAILQLLKVERLTGVMVGAASQPAASILQNLSGEQRRHRPVLRSEPGASRAATVLQALEEITRQASDQASDQTWVLVHDAARPMVQVADIDRLIDAADMGTDGGLLGWPVADSLARVQDGQMQTSVDRAGLWRAATPQVFRLGSLRDCLRAAINRGDTITDEASIMCAAGYRPVLVACAADNFKLTTVEDMAMAEQMLGASKQNIRVGTGYDVHALVPDRPLIIGGVDIPFERGLAGHSDADVLLHAIADAALGAAALGDLGRHFPDSDSRFSGISSRTLLRHVVSLLREQGMAIGNIDATVIAQAPKLARQIPQMQKNIAADCEVATELVSVKATTTEGLGFIGRGEGIAAQASVTLR